ncbi:MAG: helix-turn-helix transcriptional regulator [Desulfobacterales bacterium]|nr:helix-turn-helix transcriptional regulator [Desulfobacterales bacterium]
MKTKNIAKRTKSEPEGLFPDVEKIPRPVVVVALNYPNNHMIPAHTHESAQLLHATEGVMTVTTDMGVWVVPPGRAVWIPMLKRHEIHAFGRLSMRTVYIKSESVSGLPRECCVVSVTQLMKELILHAITLPCLYDLKGPDARVMQVILDQIKTLSVTPLDLCIPKDLRLNKIYRIFNQNPADNRSLEEWGKHVGACSRTLTRLFQEETAMSFRQWRRQFRILEALKRLGRQESVTNIALELGYDSPSAFISMFKKTLGKTPGQYYKG